MQDYQTLPIDDTFCFEVGDLSREKKLSDVAQQKIESLWHAERQSHPYLYNGQIFSVTTLGKQGLKGEFVEYKHLLAQRRAPELFKELKIHPMAVSCITETDSALLFGRRSSHVAEGKNFYELAPSGGIDQEAIKLKDGKKILDLANQALRELEEETGLEKNSVKQVLTSAIILHHHRINYEILVTIKIDESKANGIMSQTHEYDEILWVEKKDLGPFIKMNHANIIPLSLYLLKMKSLIV